MKYNFALDVMYITPHLHVVIFFWKFKIPQISNHECFSNVGDQLKSFQFFSHQNSIIKKIFSLIIYKIDYFWCNIQVQRSFITTKTHNFIFNFQHSY